MISERAFGVAGGVLGFRKELLEHLGGVEKFAGYLAEDLVFGELAKQNGCRLVLGPTVHSPVEKMSFRKLSSNLRRAHLIGLNFNAASKPISLIGIAIGYSYVLLPLLSMASANIYFFEIWMIFVMTRFLFLSTLAFVTEGQLKMNWSFLIGDSVNLASFILAIFNHSVTWGDQKHKISFRTKIV